MTTVIRSGFRKQAYDLLRERILNQEYAFGERLNIDILSRELSISNNPIREALTMLEKDGLITMTPNVGSKVIEFTTQSFHELTQTIMLFITGAYELCREDDKLDQMVVRMEEALEAQKKAENGTDLEFARAALRFDEITVKVTENDRLIRLFDSQMDVFQLALLYDYQNRKMNRAGNIAEHESILNAIKQRDHKQVRRLLRKHYAREIAES